MTNRNEPAFPHLHNMCQRKGESEMFSGLTKFEYTCIQAMNAAVSPGRVYIELSPNIVATDAVEYAVALWDLIEAQEAANEM